MTLDTSRSTLCTLISRKRAVPKPPQPIQLISTVDELARLWEAAARIGKPVWRDLARFLIAVAVPPRRGGEAGLVHLIWRAASGASRDHMTKNGNLTGCGYIRWRSMCLEARRRSAGPRPRPRAAAIPPGLRASWRRAPPRSGLRCSRASLRDGDRDLL